MSENVEKLLKEISPEAPCGTDVYAQVEELEGLLKGRVEVRIGDGGKPQEEIIQPDWSAIRAKAETLLATESKHLALALVYGATVVQSPSAAWSGVRDSLELVAGLLERYWEGLYPRLSSCLLELEHLKDGAWMIQELQRSAISLSPFLWSQFSAEAREFLQKSNPGEAADRCALLLGELNRILSSDSIYEAGRFAGLTLRKSVQALVEQNPTGADLVRLNRMLLEDAYPLGLKRAPQLPSHGDPAERASLINLLSQPPTSTDAYRFVRRVQQMKLTHSAKYGSWSYLEMQAARRPADSLLGPDEKVPSVAELEGSWRDTGAEILQATASALAGAIAAVGGITECFKGQATQPDLKELKKTLEAIAALVAAGGSQGPPEPPPDDPQRPGTSKRVATGAVQDRTQALESLASIRKFFERTEPSSPIPWLIALAEGVSKSSFMEILERFEKADVGNLVKVFGQKRSGQEADEEGEKSD